MNKQIFGVAGNPVLHSRSPFMFNSWFQKLFPEARYLRISTRKTRELIKLTSFLPLKGLNITAPFKESIIPFLHKLDDSALKTGAVNTIRVENNLLYGFNTDYIGVLRSLEKAGCPVNSKTSFLIVGSGGAARAAVYGVLKKKATVTVAARNKFTRKKISRDFSIPEIPLEKASGIIEKYHGIIFAIPAEPDNFDNFSFSEGQFVLEAGYSGNSKIAEKAKSQGAKVISGIQWLVNQALHSAYIFTGKKADEKVFSDAAGKTPKKSKIIALTGFMAAGKTSIGKKLSELSGLSFRDIDWEIEKATGMSVFELISEKGENAFRKLESKILLSSSPGILSCGGGVVTEPINCKFLKGKTLDIWIFSSPETTASRIENNKKRPLLPEKNSLESIRKLMKSRLALYAETSDMLVISENSTAESCARQIYSELLKNRFV
ncbi:MAG: shikimate kinase [bacterium]